MKKKPVNNNVIICPDFLILIILLNKQVNKKRPERVQQKQFNRKRDKIGKKIRLILGYFRNSKIYLFWYDYVLNYWFVYKLMYFIDLNKYLHKNKWITVLMLITTDFAGVEFQKKKNLTVIGDLKSAIMIFGEQTSTKSLCFSIRHSNIEFRNKFGMVVSLPTLSTKITKQSRCIGCCPWNKQFEQINRFGIFCYRPKLCYLTTQVKVIWVSLEYWQKSIFKLKIKVKKWTKMWSNELQFCQKVKLRYLLNSLILYNMPSNWNMWLILLSCFRNYTKNRNIGLQSLASGLSFCEKHMQKISWLKTMIIGFYIKLKKMKGDSPFARM